MSYPDPNRTATEIHLDTPRWIRWFKSHAGFILLCSLTVGLYVFFENEIPLPWWGVVIAYLVFVVFAFLGARFVRKCDDEIRGMR